MKKCFSCRTELELNGTPGRGDECPGCGADLKVCLNCAFFDETSYNECREPRADRVLEKTRANYCEYFQFRDASESRDSGAEEKAKEAFKKLFGE